LVRAFGGSLWRLQFALDGRPLDDELGLTKAGLYDGAVLAAAPAETTCRAYFSQQGARSMIELALDRDVEL
jgi:hypothetical protein